MSEQKGLLLVAAGDALAILEHELASDPGLASAHTRRTYGAALGDFETWRAGRPATKLLVESYAAWLRDAGKAPSTINHHLAAVRWWVRRVGDMAAEAPGLKAAKRREIVAQAERAAKVKNVKGDAEQKGRHVSDGEIRALLAHCAADRRPAGVRDAAMIALAIASGARRAEIAGLELGDLAPAADGDGYDLTIRQGKGGKTRSVSVYDGAARYLADWLALRGDAEGPLFLAIRKGGAILDHGIGTQSMQEMLAKRADAAGIAGMGWHDARRTLAGNLLDAGVDLALVQRVLGHASPATTAAYDRRPEDARRKAQRKVTVPYLGKGG